jgi:hypothetical protein
MGRIGTRFAVGQAMSINQPSDVWNVFIQLVQSQQNGQSPQNAAVQLQKNDIKYVDAALADLLYQIIGSGVQKLEDASRRQRSDSATRPTG